MGRQQKKQIDVIETILKEWSWRCEKGYPDINNPKDVQVLEELFEIYLLREQKKGYQNLSKDAQAVAEKLIKALQLSIDDIGFHARNRLVIIAPGGMKRRDVIAKLEDLKDVLGIEREFSMQGSSIGGFVDTQTGVEIIFKDSTTAKLGAAGKKNEQIFTVKVNDAIQQGVDTVIIKSDKKEEVIYNVIEAKDTSFNKIPNFKADSVLDTQDSEVSVSIKEDGIFRWASAMKDFREVLEQFVSKSQQGKIPNVKTIQDVNKPELLIVTDSNNKPYGHVYIKNYPVLQENLHKYIFGVDDALVVQRTFTDSDFEINENVLTIHCTNLYTDMKDIPAETLPIIRLERNARHATSLTNPTRRGIQLRVVPKYLAKQTDRSNILILDWKQDIVNV